MGHVAAFTSLAQPIALDRFGDDHRRFTFAVHGRLIGSENFLWVVSSPAHFLQFLVGVVFDQIEQFGMFAEEMFADIVAMGNDVFLILPVDNFHHAGGEQSPFILLQQRIPVVSPDHFDDIPTGSAERPFEFLDDLSVPSNRSIQSLQVAIDHENQVVQTFAGSQRDCTEGFGFVTFAVTQKGPNAFL